MAVFCLDSASRNTRVCPKRWRYDRARSPVSGMPGPAHVCRPRSHSGTLRTPAHAQRFERGWYGPSIPASRALFRAGTAMIARFEVCAVCAAARQTRWAHRRRGLTGRRVHQTWSPASHCKALKQLYMHMCSVWPADVRAKSGWASSVGNIFKHPRTHFAQWRRDASTHARRCTYGQ